MLDWAAVGPDARPHQELLEVGQLVGRLAQSLLAGEAH